MFCSSIAIIYISFCTCNSLRNTALKVLYNPDKISNTYNSLNVQTVIQTDGYEI